MSRKTTIPGKYKCNDLTITIHDNGDISLQQDDHHVKIEKEQQPLVEQWLQMHNVNADPYQIPLMPDIRKYDVFPYNISEYTKPYLNKKPKNHKTIKGVKDE